MLVVLATAAVAISIVLFSITRIDDRAGQSVRQSHAAVTTARLQAELSIPTLLMANGYFGLFLAPSFDDLPPETRQAARNDVSSTLTGDAIQATSDLRMPMTERDLLALHDRVSSVEVQIDKLLAGTQEGFNLEAIAERKASLKAAFDDYLSEPSLNNYNQVFGGLVQLRTELNLASTSIAENLASGQADLTGSTTFARYSMTVALAVLIVITIGATYLFARVLHSVFGASESEQRELRSATEALSFRNEQLTALYNVFTEITETLSLTYVVKATLREALKVMHADMIVMRRLKDDELTLLGALDAEGTEFANLPPVALGDGPTGRAARRGRTVRIKEDAQSQIGPNPNKQVQSGIVVPLIVGARVVGTIACWAYAPDSFTDEDERILEMMASQVATAVVAADTTDVNDHRAHHDPLTGLPNRLQLNNDINRELSNLLAEGRQAVVAMADIDYFKRFNDEFGHRVGDVTLQKVASVLRTAVRDRDHVYRYGGEEFVMVFVDAGASEAIALAERVRIAVAATPLSGDHLEPVGPVAISIGLAVLPDHATDFGKLIELADSAMYKAKQSGRNRVVLWQEEANVGAMVA